MEDIRQSKPWGKHMANLGWVTDVVKTADHKHEIRVYVLKLGWWPFSMMKVQRSEYDPDFADLARIKRKYWVVNSVIEPLAVENQRSYKKAGYFLTRFPYLATKTNIVDLTKSEKELWGGLSENARRMIKRNSEMKILEVDAKTFHPLWKKSTKVWTMKPFELKNLIEYYKGNARLVVSKKNDEYHSGLLVIYTKDMANYYQTWTSEAGRVSGAHYKLVWEEMLRAKGHGLKYFDFEGIFDKRWPQKRWLGFTEFKRRFGGKEISLPGCFFRWL